MATSRREWAIAIGGGLALAAALVAILRREPSVPPDAAISPPVAAISSPAASAPPPAQPVPATNAGDLALTGLRTGPDGGMAIIRMGGRQYRLTPGRKLPGGLMLLRTEPGRAVLSGPGGEQLLAFPDAPATSPAAAPPPGGDPTPWRLALTAVKDGNIVKGWRLGSLSGLPLLARAGLKSGDILISANGQELLSEEKIIELPQELALNGKIDLRYRRGGAERTATVSP
jgi:hypothetical protein